MSEDEYESPVSAKAHARWLAGGRPTVGNLTQLTPDGFRMYFVGKLRGQIICNEQDEYRFQKSEQAMDAARWFRKHAKAIAEGAQS